MDQVSGTPLANPAPPPTPVNPVVAASPPVPSVPPLTAIPVPTAPTEPKKKSKIWLIILIVLAILLGVGIRFWGDSLLFLIISKKYIVQYPQKIPSGFKESGMAGTSVGDNGRRVIIIEFANKEGERFTFNVEAGGIVDCKPPSPSTNPDLTLSDFTEFLPNGVEKGCAVTLNSTKAGKKRSFLFLKDGTKFVILTYGLPITDVEAMEIANSLAPRTIRAFEIH